MKYQIITAMGYDVHPLDIEARARMGRPFVICKDALGDTDFLELPRYETSKPLAQLLSHRMRKSGGRMVHFDGKRFHAITWDNWKEFWAMVAPGKPDTYKYSIPLKGPRRSEAEEMFEEVKPKLQDLPKHAGKAVYPW